jgi:hypothetical protein
MQTVFSERLLAELRARHDENGRIEVERVQVQSEDPDDDPDPTIACPRLSVRVADQNVEKIYTLPADQAEQTSGCWPDTGEGVKRATIDGRHSISARFTESRGTPYDAAQSCSFMLYEPHEPPPWRRQETLEERTHREMIEDCGSWVGE